MAVTRRIPLRKSTAVSPRRGSTGRSSVPEPVRVIGVGASAGGLDALERFLEHVPADSGLAILIVQHLDPSHPTDLPVLLQRVTRLPVRLAKNGVVIQGDAVYVITPNRNLAIRNGLLQVTPQPKARGVRLPVDFLFRSLAAAYGSRSVGIILSGMGVDGTEGLRAICASGGLGVAQLPATAKFPSMPASAIAAGLAAIVVAPEEVAPRLIEYQAVQRAPAHLPERFAAATSPPGLDDVISLLDQQSGHDFAGYKCNTVVRRIERRMAIHGQSSMATYAAFLREHPAEIALLGKELLIGVTGFFRDRRVWDELAHTVVPALLARHPLGKPIRIWVPGCSTGEEAYSLAMLFIEAAEKLGHGSSCRLQVFATDLNAEAIEQARRGTFPESITAEVSAERLARHFTTVEGGYQVTKVIRQAIIFATHDVNADPPFTKVDLISCRNLMIYFAPELQARLLRLFQFCLVESGVLVLGTAETTAPGSALFEPIDASLRIFRRLGHGSRNDITARRSGLGNGSSRGPAAWTPMAAPQGPSCAEAALLERYAPPAVVVNEQGDILQFLGRLGRYLEPASGKANLNLYAMARPAVRHAVATVLQSMSRRKGAGLVRAALVLVGGAPVEVSGVRLQDAAAPRGTVLVTFAKVAAVAAESPKGRKVAVRESPAGAARLRRAEQENRTLRVEMQQFQEQLQSSNEELQATNEELQTADEELTTSQEEMQSTNEELQSVNAELQSELARLATVNGDLQNLLNSANVAIVFLDSALNVRRYTREALSLFRLTPGDVGRPLGDIKSDLVDWDLGPNVDEMLRTLTITVRELTTQDSRWYECRILPYRTVAGIVDGAVLTFTDITTAKRLEATLRSTVARTPTRGRGGAGDPT